MRGSFAWVKRGCGTVSHQKSHQSVQFFLPISICQVHFAGGQAAIIQSYFHGRWEAVTKKGAVAKKREKKGAVAKKGRPTKKKEPGQKQARSYASLKLRLTDSLTYLLTGVKCRATSVAKNGRGKLVQFHNYFSRSCLRKTRDQFFRLFKRRSEIRLSSKGAEMHIFTHRPGFNIEPPFRGYSP